MFIVNQTMIIIIEHHALFMWNQSRWNIGREHRKRERAIADWGEGERTDLARENGVGFIKDSYFWFWPIVLNQHEVFLDITTGHIPTEIFWDNVNSKSTLGLFLGKVFTSNSFSGAMTSTRITLRFSIILLFYIYDSLPCKLLIHIWVY